MKKTSSILILIILMVSCQENNNHSFDSEKESVTDVLEKFPMINQNLTTVKKIDLDTLSITLLRNSKKKAYDEVVVFKKKNKFYAIPFFSNMYADYWNFENDNQPKLFPKTNSTFAKELSKLIVALNLKPNEFGILFDELMGSTLNTEKDPQKKPYLFQNTVYLSRRVDKYKSEEIDNCSRRNNLLFDQMMKNYNKKAVVIMYQYYFDRNNGRVYKIENKAENFDEINFIFKTYRIDCYYQPMIL